MSAPAPRDANLNDLQLLQDFKRKMPQAGLDANLSPFADRVTTENNLVSSGDVPGIHEEVRAHVVETIEAVRDGRLPSQVILISGEAGVGKSHLLKTFRGVDSMDRLGHLFVGSSNHWNIKEFEAFLLDRVITSLTAPSPSQSHPLHERISAIAFKAVDHLLNNRKSWKNCVSPRARRWWNRLFRPSRALSFERLGSLARARDPKLFRYLDFAAFSNDVCDRFLAERSNPTHRIALRVLLLSLFPDPAPSGIGTRERVLDWFRGRADLDYFARRLGTRDQPDRSYGRMEAVKLFAHLFSNSISEKLSTEQFPCRPRVFLLAFDQAESRHELFETREDWNDFFAHLSELYNTLPNVVILFTMTLGLKDQLHAMMERQFKDRIRMDEKFILRLPTQDQVLCLYRERIEEWIGKNQVMAERYRNAENSFLPLSREELLRLSTSRSIRDILVQWDAAFRRKLSELSVDAAVDYLYERNELVKEATRLGKWDYTANHLQSADALLGSVGSVLGSAFGIEIRERELGKLETTPYLRFVFGQAGRAETITVYVGRVGNRYNLPIEKMVSEFLRNREKIRTFLWVIRPEAIPDRLEVVEDRYEKQVVTDIVLSESESVVRALTTVETKRSIYTERLGSAAGLDELIAREIGRTYLGRMFRYARSMLDSLT